MSSAWSPRRKVKLGASRYPARLRWLAMLVVWPAIMLSSLPGWAMLVLLGVLPVMLLG